MTYDFRTTVYAYTRGIFIPGVGYGLYGEVLEAVSSPCSGLAAEWSLYRLYAAHLGVMGFIVRGEMIDRSRSVLSSVTDGWSGLEAVFVRADAPRVVPPLFGIE